MREEFWMRSWSINSISGRNKDSLDSSIVAPDNACLSIGLGLLLYFFVIYTLRSLSRYFYCPFDLLESITQHVAQKSGRSCV